MTRSCRRGQPSIHWQRSSIIFMRLKAIMRRAMIAGEFCCLLSIPMRSALASRGRSLIWGILLTANKPICPPIPTIRVRSLSAGSRCRLKRSMDSTSRRGTRQSRERESWIPIGANHQGLRLQGRPLLSRQPETSLQQGPRSRIRRQPTSPGQKRTGRARRPTSRSRTENFFDIIYFCGKFLCTLLCVKEVTYQTRISLGKEALMYSSNFSLVTWFLRLVDILRLCHFFALLSDDIW